MEEKWIRDIKDKLTDYQAEMPEGVLDNVMQALRQSEGARRKAVVWPMWRKVAVAATAALVVGFGGWWWWHGDEAADMQVTSGRQDTPSHTLAAEEVDTKEVINLKPNEALPLVAMASAQEVASAQADMVMPTMAIAPQTGEIPAETEQAEQPAKENDTKPRTANPARTARITMPRQQKAKGTWALSGYVRGGLGTNSNQTYGARMSSAVANDAPQFGDDIPMLYVAEKAELLTLSKAHTKIDHRQPIKVGVSLRIPLSERWSITTGVDYSYLASDLTQETADASIDTKQTLHYVGIPVNANYSVYRTNRLNVYATAGAEVEKLVSGKRGDDKVKEGRPQLSAGMAVGAEYRIVDQLSVYAEPGATYHFDNGSEVDNIYKDRPLNVNVQVGLRWELK